MPYTVRNSFFLFHYSQTSSSPSCFIVRLYLMFNRLFKCLFNVWILCLLFNPKWLRNCFCLRLNMVYVFCTRQHQDTHNTHQCQVIHHSRAIRPRGRTITFEVGWTGSCWTSRVAVVVRALVLSCGIRSLETPTISCGTMTSQREQFAANSMIYVSTGMVNQLRPHIYCVFCVKFCIFRMHAAQLLSLLKWERSQNVVSN